MVGIVERLRQTRADMLGTPDEAHYWDCVEAAAVIEKLRAAKVELLRLFDEAMDGYADCIPYKGEYLIKKHGDEENFAALRAAAAALKETGDE